LFKFRYTLAKCWTTFRRSVKANFGGIWCSVGLRYDRSTVSTPRSTIQCFPWGNSLANVTCYAKRSYSYRYQIDSLFLLPFLFAPFSSSLLLSFFVNITTYKEDIFSKKHLFSILMAIVCINNLHISQIYFSIFLKTEPNNIQYASVNNNNIIKAKISMCSTN